MILIKYKYGSQLNKNRLFTPANKRKACAKIKRRKQRPGRAEKQTERRRNCEKNHVQQII